MSAVDATTLRQVSTAALIGLDARVLLTTDEPAVHAVYDRVIDTARLWWIARAEQSIKNQAIAIVNEFNEALKK